MKDKPIGVYAYYDQYKNYMLHNKFFDELFHIPVDFPERVQVMELKDVVYLEQPTAQVRAFLQSRIR